MTYTNAEIRGAILKTADVFERRPDLFNFNVCRTPKCNTPGCAIGYITMFLGVCSHDFDATAKQLGYLHAGCFYDEMDQFASKEWIRSASLAALGLRKIADAKFPLIKSAQMDSAYLAFKASFTRSVEAA